MLVHRTILLVTILWAAAVAGCIDGQTPIAPPEISDPDIAATTITRISFSGDGNSEGFACLADVCHYAQASSEVELPHDGAIQTLHANVTWTPRDPTISHLEIFLFTETADGDWSYSFDEGHYWHGTSPLVITSELWEENVTGHFLHGRAIHRPIDGQRTGGGLSQDYHVEGFVELVPMDHRHD